MKRSRKPSYDYSLVNCLPVTTPFPPQQCVYLNLKTINLEQGTAHYKLNARYSLPFDVSAFHELTTFFYIKKYKTKYDFVII